MQQDALMQQDMHMWQDMYMPLQACRPAMPTVYTYYCLVIHQPQPLLLDILLSLV